MKIMYFITAFLTSIVFTMYKVVEGYDFSDGSNKVKTVDIPMKKVMRDGLLLFIIASAANYVFGEYVYKDFLEKIFKQSTKPNVPEVFTDRPGF
tara:strand:- start:1883 stop:2164 length:282 start_codon:yes stop_codon:yes gene_type:complete